MAGRQKRKLRNFLIDGKVQVRIVAIMVLLSTALTAGLGTFWYSEMRKASGVIRVNTISTLGQEAAEKVGAELAAQDHLRLLVLSGFALLLGLLVACTGIVMTHKIAGPLFRISRHMKDIAEDRLDPLWGLRKGDQLQEFFAGFKAMHEALRERKRQEIELLDHLVEAIERGDDLTRQLPQIKQARAQKHESLGEAGG